MPARPAGSLAPVCTHSPKTPAFESSPGRLFYVLPLVFVLDRTSPAADGMDPVCLALKVNR